MFDAISLPSARILANGVLAVRAVIIRNLKINNIMQNLNRLETAKLLINTFYEETILDTSLLDTTESANEKILADFELAKRMAFKCADMLHKEHTHNHPISWNIKRQQFYAEVKTLIESLTMRNVFESNRATQR